MEGNFHLHDIIKVFLKRIKLLIIIPVLFAIAGYLISTMLIQPTYEAKVDLLINDPITQDGEKFTTSDIETNLRLIKTYQYIIQSDRVTSLVAKKMKNKYSNKQLKDKLQIDAHNNSQIMQLSIKDHDLNAAVNIVNLYADITQEEIKSLMQMENIMILTKADTHKYKQPIMPKPIITTIISFFIGLLGICLYIAIVNYFFSNISSKQDIERLFTIPFLGSVGRIKQLSKRKRKTTDTLLTTISHQRDNALPTPISEAYRTIRTNLDFQMSKGKLSTILVTSTVKGEGKTTTAANIARMMALNNKKTIIIDADLRKERIHSNLEEFGLFQYLSLDYPIKQVMQPTLIDHLHYIPAGIVPQNPAELLASKKMDDLLDALKEDYDRIIIDSPPLFFSDPVILSTRVDGCLIITQADKTKVHSLQQALKKLTNVNATIFGIIINNKRLKRREKEFYNYYGVR